MWFLVDVGDPISTKDKINLQCISGDNFYFVSRFCKNKFDLNLFLNMILKYILVKSGGLIVSLISLWSKFIVSLIIISSSKSNI